MNATVHRAALRALRAGSPMIILVLALTLGCECRALPSDSDRPELSRVRLEIAHAWRDHPTRQAASAKLRAAHARAAASGQPVYNPELELAADHEGPDDLRTLSLSQTLDLSGKRRARRALGKADLAVGTAEFAQARAAFVYAWLSAWVQMAALDRQVALGEQRVALAERLATLAERQVSAGDLAGPERDLVLLARDEAIAQQALLLTDAANAAEAFANAGGKMAAIPLPAEPPPEIPAAAPVVDPLPALQVATAQAASAAQQVEVAAGDRHPDPTLSLRSGVIDSDAGNDPVIGIAISIPLFVRNSYSAEVDAARADAESAQERVLLQQSELQARARRTGNVYAATRRAWLAWRSSRATDLPTRTRGLERLWTAGELSTSDYVVQLGQTLDTALAGAALEGRVWQAYFDDLEARGTLTAWAGLEGEP